MQIESVSVQRLYLQIAARLAEHIQSGEIAEGQRLPSERDLAARFSVSRPTIREAMIALEVGGLVEVRSGSGIYVLPRSTETGLRLDENLPGPYEILEARRLIESEVAAQAAQRISNEELRTLQELAQRMSEAVEAGEIEQAERIDRDFHCLIAAASRNSALQSTVGWLWQLRNQSEISTAFHRVAREQGSTPRTAEHEAIYTALVRRDADGARQAMRTHLERVIDQFGDSILS